MRDYRLCAAAAAAWGGALIGHAHAYWVAVAVSVLVMLASRRRGVGTGAAAVLLLVAGAWLGALHSSGGPTPLRELAGAQAQVRVVATISAPPHAVVGRYATR